MKHNKIGEAIGFVAVFGTIYVIALAATAVVTPFYWLCGARTDQ